MPIIYIVGTPPTSVIESVGPDFMVNMEDQVNQPILHVPMLPWYYIDCEDDDTTTRIFESTSNPSKATQFKTFVEAEQWVKKFLCGKGIVYRVS